MTASKDLAVSLHRPWTLSPDGLIARSVGTFDAADDGQQLGRA